MSKFGWYHVPNPPSAIHRFHFYDGTSTLKTVDHEPKVGVLDQEDLTSQGIYTSQFISHGQDEDALGSCTCQTMTEALSNILPEEDWCHILDTAVGPGAKGPDGFGDVVGAERGAIALYADVTHRTGDPPTEWEPTDCGSSGYYLYQYATSKKYIRTERIAHGATNIVSVMQKDGILIGMPWLNAWMEPGPDAVLDGDGSMSTLQQQIDQGLAGGHEIYGSAIEKLVTEGSQVNAHKTIIRIRNHWDPSWGDHGSARFHLSTLVALGANVDIRQFVA